MGKVIPISKSKKYKKKAEFEFPVEIPEDSLEAKEERFLNAMMLGSKLMSQIEDNRAEQVIIFVRGKNGWWYDYSNINSPGHIIEALAPLWYAARTSIKVLDE
jgi:hypothetical protein